jgi:alpha-glucosidase
VGDLRGIADRLDHLAWLGVDALWLSPFYPSPQVDFGYDVTDHCAVDPLFGTLEDFDALLAAAHRRGLRVVVDLVFNFAFWRQPWSADAFRSVVDEFTSGPMAGRWPTWALGNHDVPRLATRYGAEGAHAGRARVAATMLLTLPGTPFVYYGDEVGMPDARVPAELARDPDGRDPCRAPMPWDGTVNAGFSTGRPWLPIAGSAGTSVSVQRRDPSSLLNLYRCLIRLRRTSPALAAGAYQPIDAGPGVFAYERAAAGQRLRVALNFNDHPVELPALGRPC